MTQKRIVYRNWIVDMGRDPAAPGPLAESPGDREIAAAVQQALERLTEEEREFVIRFHYMGESYRRLARLTGRRLYKLESLHKRIMRKLRRALAPFVLERYGIGLEQESDCVLCRSGDREEIDRMIAVRDRRRSWRPVIKALRRHFGIRIPSPQTLVSHENYHMSMDHTLMGGTRND